MKIPLYWSKAAVEEQDRRGQPLVFSCWRSSEKSVEDAHDSALDAAKKILQNFLAGRSPDHYWYGNGPIREEVLERFPDTEGGLFAAVTRNRYGALVLNTASVCFIDLDFPSTSLGSLLKHFFARLLGKNSVSPDVLHEAEVVGRVEQFAEEHPHWGFRVYRTRAGVRLLATHDLFDPLAGDVTEACEFLHADPLYVRLCRTQQCFRARLTPKPWRCKHFPNTIGWPREDPASEKVFEEWLAKYDANQSQFATCRLVASLGNSTIHPDVEGIIEIHDKMTRAMDSAPLA